MSFFSYSRRTADATRSDGGRNLIGFRTQSDWTADGGRRHYRALCTSKVHIFYNISATKKSQ